MPSATASLHRLRVHHPTEYVLPRQEWVAARMAATHSSFIVCTTVVRRTSEVSATVTRRATRKARRQRNEVSPQRTTSQPACKRAISQLAHKQHRKEVKK